MKIKIAILALFFILPQLVLGQLIPNYGVKIGYTSADVQAEVYDEFFERRPGVNVALFAEWLENPFFSVITQVEYAQRGFIEEQIESVESSMIIQKVEANTRLDYLSIPVMLKVSRHAILHED